MSVFRHCSCYLQQLKSGQKLPGSAVPPVNLEVLQLWREPRGSIMLITHLDGGLCEGPTYELCLTLYTTMCNSRQPRQ